MSIRFSRKFKKQHGKAPLKIRKAFYQRLTLFEKDKFSPLLNNHALSGQWRGYRSINISGDWRAVFIESTRSNLVIFVALGTHSQLYG
ncbi:TPA: hypothetical protein DEQ95_03835 [Candidatus Beckwithbacteria bacterium]|nr:MAG: toxin of the YafQ-DinJ toxin-antitoxin system [Candidatus Beckwithbacteria bacterium GW2011_GWC1_49_16]OGD48797.1 MAG: hypothetical protein A2877_03940 [Candidatus Beckwithbacteria bacterium RIFCSPHIGHO2_01_FULL_49_39]OGD49924.1 MAG: hypothetical protein A3D86_04620 [Candidatus Beckwithbacteria bacterium RIFCSPHIGHO2_02_FULL_49_13]OGD50297.1 MAG: hypothetical protein A3K56_01240 [Candidatus Beckwithbacteria bacterium RIFCSPHIGHO2_12_FULL_49_13]OGD59063.1 MAG: hypothetical protein A3J22_